MTGLFDFNLSHYYCITLLKLNLTKTLNLVKTMKSFIKPLIVASALLFTTNALALDPVFTAVFSDKAIRGYDTVTYFTENKPVEGSDEFTVEYQGATWLFSSQENKELFEAEPTKYAPQYGGYCAYAVSQNKTASIKPELFTIHDGKLYLNYSKSVNEKWLKNKESFIQDADKNWPALLTD